MVVVVEVVVVVVAVLVMVVVVILVAVISIPAKAFARDYGITGVRLSVCLSVTTITK